MSEERGARRRAPSTTTIGALVARRESSSSPRAAATDRRARSGPRARPSSPSRSRAAHRGRACAPSLDLAHDGRELERREEALDRGLVDALLARRRHPPRVVLARRSRSRTIVSPSCAISIRESSSLRHAAKDVVLAPLPLALGDLVPIEPEPERRGRGRRRRGRCVVACFFTRLLLRLALDSSSSSRRLAARSAARLPLRRRQRADATPRSADGRRHEEEDVAADLRAIVLGDANARAGTAPSRARRAPAASTRATRWRSRRRAPPPRYGSGSRNVGDGEHARRADHDDARAVRRRRRASSGAPPPSRPTSGPPRSPGALLRRVLPVGGARRCSTRPNGLADVTRSSCALAAPGSVARCIERAKLHDDARRRSRESSLFTSAVRDRDAGAGCATKRMPAVFGNASSASSSVTRSSSSAMPNGRERALEVRRDEPGLASAGDRARREEEIAALEQLRPEALRLLLRERAAEARDDDDAARLERLGGVRRRRGRRCAIS